MKIKTNEDLYVGRYSFKKKNGRHEAFFNAIIPYGMTEPFKIDKGTEVRTLNDKEFNSMDEFLETLEEGMFKFVFTDKAQEELF